MDIKSVIIKIIFAIIASGLIGYEREMRDRPAGFRTHILVCVGAAIVSLIQLRLMEDTVVLISADPTLANSLKVDIGRVIAQVVTGVGFLGAGTIIFHKGNVRGLTTATTLWTVACLGLAIGLGYYKISLIATFAILFVIVVLKKIEDDAKKRKYDVTLFITYSDKRGVFIDEIVRIIKKKGCRIRDFSIKDSSGDNKVLKIEIYLGILVDAEKIINAISKNKSVIAIKRG